MKYWHYNHIINIYSRNNVLNRGVPDNDRYLFEKEMSWLRSLLVNKYI